MRKRIALITLILGTLLISTGCVSQTDYDKVTQDYHSLDLSHQELQAKYDDLVQSEDDLNASLEKIQSDFNQLSTDQSKLKADLSATTLKLLLAVSEREDLKQKMDTLQIENSLLVNKLSGTLPILKGDGSKVYLENNFGNTHNPTLPELRSFLRDDTTENIQYRENLFNCTIFAEHLHNNAEAKGLRAAFVGILFKNQEIGHAVVAFYLADQKRLIYIDDTGVGHDPPGTDCEDTVEIGQALVPHPIFNTGEVYKSMGVVSDIIYYW